MKQKKVPVYISYGKDNFNYMYNMYKNFLETVPFEKLKRKKSNNKDAGIIVAPRNNSGIPFCSLTIALIYLHKGHSVKIIWDDLMFLDDEIKYQNYLLGGLIDFICQKADIQHLKLSEMKDKEFNAEDDQQIKRLAKANAIWNVRKVVPSDELDGYTIASYDVLRNNAKKINYFYSNNDFDHCIHQSLINENGGVHKIFANKYNIRLGSLDIAAGKGQMSTDNVPGYHNDLFKIINEPIFNDEVNKRVAIEEAKKEFKYRMYAKDTKGYQIVSFQEDQNKYKNQIIIPLNILWDGAALNRNRLFDTPFDWLDQTIEFILNETTSNVAVRQHPAERKYKIYGTGDDLARYLKNKYSHNSRFAFISCYDKVNTYSLVRDSKIVLPYTSSVGLEAALLGKKVIIESDVYYSDLSIVSKPSSKHDYFEEIKEATKTKSKTNNGSKQFEEETWLLYFLVHECPRIFSDFGLEPKDFSRWTIKGFNALINDENIACAIDGLATNKAYAYMNSKRILERLRKKSSRSFDIPVEHYDEIRKSINEVVQLINDERYDLALKVINIASNKYKDIYLYPKAFSCAKLGRMKESKKILIQLKKIKPNNRKAIRLQFEIKNRRNLDNDLEVQNQSN